MLQVQNEGLRHNYPIFFLSNYLSHVSICTIVHMPIFNFSFFVQARVDFGGRKEERGGGEVEKSDINTFCQKKAVLSFSQL